MASAATGDPVLARVDLRGALTNFALPVYAHLRDRDGQEYLLVCAEAAELPLTGLSFQVLDTNAVPETYVLAHPMRPGSGVAAAGFRIVHDDGVQWIVRAAGNEAALLSEAGYALARLPSAPIRRMSRIAATPDKTGPARQMQGIVYDPLVAEMVGQVRTNRLAALLRRISGVENAIAAGNLLPLVTRHTYSGAPIQAATQSVYEHLQALGMDVRFHYWSSGRNVEGTLRGGTRSNEIVVLVAHLDDMPSGASAPGADDNGSGTAGVLMAAEICRKFHFDRTIRFLLVTGEEQGLLGSATYATNAAHNAETIVAVLAMDMIAWDSNSDGVLDLYTRFISDPDYSNDFVIASTFAHVVEQYDMETPLTPRIFPDSGVWYSDHSSFWNAGYPAVLAIEAYHTDAVRDFNANYHTVNDTFDKLNLPYFAAITRASVGTLAHLAYPVARNPLDILEVANSAAASGIGAGIFYARHETGATGSGGDPLDQTWAAAPANTNAFWLKIQTEPYGVALRADSRPVTDETVFAGTLLAVITNAGTRSCTNRLRFAFLTPPPPDRLYLARLHVPGRYTADSNDFTCVTNLRQVIADGGYLDLPILANISNGAVYGTCEIGARFLNTDRSNCAFRAISVTGAQAVVSLKAQAGALISDRIEVSTNLLQTNGWQLLTSPTSTVSAAPLSFDSGWTSVAHRIPASSLTNSAAYYFRVKRSWPAP